MSASTKRMTVAEFLDWEARQELRHEFDGTAPVAMAGGSRAHARIQRNLAIAVGTRLRGSKCEFLGSDMKLELNGRIRYPDGFVVCSRGQNDQMTLSDPVVIFEVLSPTTASYDRIVKRRDYQSVGSVMRYVMIEQDRPAATFIARQAKSWISDVVAQDETLDFPEIGISVPLAELYEGVIFGDPGVENTAQT